MKSSNYVKVAVAIAALLFIGFISLKSFAQHKEQASIASDVDLNISINKNTTQSELDEIQSMLIEHGIDSELNDIKFNDTGELVGIRVKLSDDTNQTVMTSVSSNTGINKISFGRKNGRLYVSQDDLQNGPMAFFNMPEFQFGFENDSLANSYFKNFSQFNFEDFFMKEDPLFLNEMDSLGMGNLIENFRDKMNTLRSQRFQNPYKFIDDPNTEKLIIINGKESDFEELDKLAKQNNIKAIDHLKPETAQSIYGPKAKDGAVIVITKD